MRKSFNGLSGLVRGQLGSNPLSGDLFVLCNGCKTQVRFTATRRPAGREHASILATRRSTGRGS